jgi:hypothetical protein
MYDGTQYIYQGATSVATAVTTVSYPISASDFTGKNTIYLPSVAQTVTLPCANTITPNGVIYLFSNTGQLTLSNGACADNIHRNNLTSITNIAIAQGAPLTAVTTDGVSNFYVSGQ